MSRDVFVAGVGMIPFTKPGASEPYPQMGAKATRAALADAGIDYDQVQQAYVGYVYGDSTAGQRALYEVGMTGIPVVNVNNNCSTGSTALFLARQAVASGAVDCVLALGFEQMSPGALGAVFNDRPSPFERFDDATDELVGHGEIPLALRYFGGAGLAHMEQYGTPAGHLREDPRQGQPPRGEQPAGAVPQRGHRRGGDGLADDVARRADAPDGLPADLRRGRGDRLLGRLREGATGSIASVRIQAQAMTTDRPVTFEARDMREVVGFGMARDAAAAGLRGGRHRPAGRRRRRTARLLRAERTAQLRGAGPVPAWAAPRSSSATATTPTAARSSPTRRAACCPRAIRWARPAWRSAPS